MVTRKVMLISFRKKSRSRSPDVRKKSMSRDRGRDTRSRGKRSPSLTPPSPCKAKKPRGEQT